MSNFLSQKVCVVTGAGGGIGRHLCLQLMREKAIVFAADKNPETLIPLSEEAAKFGYSLYCVELDVRRTEDLSGLLRKVLDTESRLDVWINNAGISGISPFLTQSDEDFERVMDVNMNSLIQGTRIALKYFESQGAGSIVNMASVAGHVAPPLMSAYAASKHAVVGFTRALQEELRLSDSSVHLMLVSPGFVDTAILNKGARMGFPEWLQWMVSKPERVASEILNGIRKKKIELQPTWNGRAVLGAHRVFPKATRRSAKILLTRKFSDWVFNRYEI